MSPLRAVLRYRTNRFDLDEWKLFSPDLLETTTHCFLVLLAQLLKSNSLSDTFGLTVLILQEISSEGNFGPRLLHKLGPMGQLSLSRYPVSFMPVLGKNGYYLGWVDFIDNAFPAVYATKVSVTTTHKCIDCFGRKWRLYGLTFSFMLGTGSCLELSAEIEWRHLLPAMARQHVWARLFGLASV